MNIAKHHSFESHKYNSKFKTIDMSKFVLELIVTHLYNIFVFFAYYFILKITKARTTLISVTESKAVIIGLLCVTIIYFTH